MPSLLLPRYLLPAMSDKKSPPRKEKPIIVRTPHSDDKGMKRKLLSPGSPTNDDDDKRTPSKRKRGSVSLESSPIAGHLVNPKTPGSGSRSVPLSERQQLAMIMRMSDETSQGGLLVPEKVMQKSILLKNQVAESGDPDQQQRHDLHFSKSAEDPIGKPPSPSPVQPLRKTPLDKKVHKRNERGELPIHLAAIKGDVKLLKRLIKAGADVNVADFAGWTPLHEASNRGWLYVAKQLLKAGANVNVQGLENDTPLHDASINGHRKVVELLLKHGANPLQANSKGKTPLDVAASQEMVRLLKKEIICSGSDTSSIDDVRSPLSPDSINSKDEDRGLDSEENNLHRTGSFTTNNNNSNGQKISMPKSPDGKLTSPRLCLKFQRDNQLNKKSKDSKEPQYKSYSVTSVTTNMNAAESSGGEMFTPVDSPTSSVDSDLYNPRLDLVTNFSGSQSHLANEENNHSQHSSNTNLALPLIKLEEGNSNALELFPGLGFTNNNHKNNDSKVFNSTQSSMGTAGQSDTLPLRTCESQSFLPHLDWSDTQKEDSLELPDIDPTPQHIPSSTAAAVSESVACVSDSVSSVTDESQCNSVSSTGVCEAVASSVPHSTHNQSIVTSTTGSNNISLTQESDRDITSCVRAVLESVENSVCSNSVSTHCTSSNPPLSQVTSLKWELRSSAASPRNDDGSNLFSKSETLHTNSPPKMDNKDLSKPDKSSRPASPKVPPLKIIIPTKSQPSTSTTDTNDGLKLLVTNVKSAHPYVINPFQGGPMRETADENLIYNENTDKSLSSFPTSQNQSTCSSLNQSPKPESDIPMESTVDLNCDEKPSDLDLTEECDYQPQDKLSDSKSDTDSVKKEDNKEEITPRVLRSSVRLQQQSETIKPAKPVKQLQEKSDKNSNADSSSGTEAAIVPGTRSIKEEEDLDIHPRKRKIKTKSDPGPQEEGPTPTESPGLGPIQFDKVPNPFELYLGLRKKIVNRRRSLANICPKIPQGFKDYVMNTCNYVLQGNTTSTLSVPTLSPPNSVTDKMRDLFVQQEEARYKLRLQHLIEREKLMLSIEQEMLREHGRAARAMVNQGTPLSVCTILKDEEIYNIANTDQAQMEEKDKKNRTRYNGRQFLSWIQDVDDKYEKIKELLILRQKQEADSLFAIQKLEWEWRLKELGLCDRNSTPEIDDLHVPLVQVTDNFDLLPT